MNVHRMLEDLNRQRPGITVTQADQGAAEPPKLDHWETGRFKLVDLRDSTNYSAAEWLEHGLAEIKLMNGMVGGGYTMHAQTLWGGELWNKSDVRVEVEWTKDLYEAVRLHMQNRREKDLEAVMTRVHQGEGEDVQMIKRELRDLTLWTGKSPGFNTMQLQLQGSTPEMQSLVPYFEFRLWRPGPLKDMEQDAQAVEIRKLLSANIPHAEYVLSNVEIIAGAGLAESKPNHLEHDPLGTPFLVLAGNKTALRAVFQTMKPWMDEGISIEVNSVYGDLRLIMRACSPIFAGEVSLKRMRFHGVTGTFSFSRYGLTTNLISTVQSVFALVTINSHVHDLGSAFWLTVTRAGGTQLSRTQIRFKGWQHNPEDERDVCKFFDRLVEHEAALNPLVAGLYLEKWKYGWNIIGYVFVTQIGRLCQVLVEGNLMVRKISGALRYIVLDMEITETVSVKDSNGRSREKLKNGIHNVMTGSLVATSAPVGYEEWQAMSINGRLRYVEGRATKASVRDVLQKTKLQGSKKTEAKKDQQARKPKGPKAWQVQAEEMEKQRQQAAGGPGASTVDMNAMFAMFAASRAPRKTAAELRAELGAAMQAQAEAMTNKTNAVIWGTELAAAYPQVNEAKEQRNEMRSKHAALQKQLEVTLQAEVSAGQKTETEATAARAAMAEEHQVGLQALEAQYPVLTIKFRRKDGNSEMSIDEAEAQYTTIEDNIQKLTVQVAALKDKLGIKADDDDEETTRQFYADMDQDMKSWYAHMPDYSATAMTETIELIRTKAKLGGVWQNPWPSSASTSAIHALQRYNHSWTVVKYVHYTGSSADHCADQRTSQCVRCVGHCTERCTSWCTNCGGCEGWSCWMYAGPLRALADANVLLKPGLLTQSGAQQCCPSPYVCCAGGAAPFKPGQARWVGVGRQAGQGGAGLGHTAEGHTRRGAAKPGQTRGVHLAYRSLVASHQTPGPPSPAPLSSSSSGGGSSGGSKADSKADSEPNSETDSAAESEANSKANSEADSEANSEANSKPAILTLKL
jgi:hypothetical protein